MKTKTLLRDALTVYANYRGVARFYRPFQRARTGRPFGSETTRPAGRGGIDGPLTFVFLDARPCEGSRRRNDRRTGCATDERALVNRTAVCRFPTGRAKFGRYEKLA